MKKGSKKRTEINEMKNRKKKKLESGSLTWSIKLINLWITWSKEKIYIYKLPISRVKEEISWQILQTLKGL